MRAQCSICSDLFDEQCDVAAIKCGHTFHYPCLQKWLDQSMTCPQCRQRCTHKQIIHKLYFDIDVNPTEHPTDSSKLINDLGNARLALKQKDREKAELIAEQQRLKEEVKNEERNRKSAEKLYQTERTSTKALQKEILYYQQLQDEAQAAKLDAANVRKQLKDLKAVQTLVIGLESDVQEMVGSHGDARQLATWCAVLKKEHSNKKQECRTLQKEADKAKLELISKKKVILEKTTELARSQEHVKSLENDLNSADDQISSLKKKLNKLTEAIASPSETKTSYLHRLVNESPAPLPPSKRAKLSPHTPAGCPPDVSMSSTPQFNTTLELFPDEETGDTSSIAEPSPVTKKTCSEYGTQYIKISSAAGSQAKKPKRDMSDISNLSNFNLFKKKEGSGMLKSSVFKKGYNGLGGHETFIKPLPRPVMATQVTRKPQAKVVAPRTKSFTLGKAPPLPSLDGFINLDSP